jgi:hypothetical protein
MRDVQTGLEVLADEARAALDKAGLRAFGGDEALFLNALHLREGFADELPRKERDPRVLASVAKVAAQWSRAPLLSFLYDSDWLELAVHWHPRARAFLVLAGDTGASGLLDVCGGGTWPAGARDSWRVRIPGVIADHVARTETCIPLRVDGIAHEWITPLELACAFARSPPYADRPAREVADELGEAFRKDSPWRRPRA